MQNTDTDIVWRLLVHVAGNTQSITKKDVLIYVRFEISMEYAKLKITHKVKVKVYYLLITTAAIPI